MKRIFFVIVFSFLVNFSYSQGNLQFSRIIYINCTDSQSDTLITIPVNKVWKITAIYTENTSDHVKMDENIIYYGNYSNFDRFNTFWLPDGTFYFRSALGDGFSISAIEYNIVP